MRRSIFLAFIAVFALLSGSDVFAQVSNQALTRGQAIRNLTNLQAVYNVNLDNATELQVIEVCRSLQDGAISNERAELVATSQRYQDVAKTIDNQILFTANNLRNMSEDTSSMDIASFHLSQTIEAFVDSADIYLQSLDSLLIIDCQVSSELFVVGLEDARVRQTALVAAGTDLTDYIDVELKSRLGNVRNRLKEIEGI